jgi:hypothetical protein
VNGGTKTLATLGLSLERSMSTAEVGATRRNAQSDRTHEEQVREKMLDKTLADSFPTSDPPSTIPDPSEDSLD